MQTVGAIVLWQLVGLAVQSETPIAYTVGITSNEGAKVGEMILRKIVVEVVKPKHYITEIAIAVGHQKRNNTGTEVGDAGCEAVAVGQRINIHNHILFSKEYRQANGQRKPPSRCKNGRDLAAGADVHS